MKTRISSIVDSPDTLNRQNNSLPSSNPPESQATLASNKCRASRKVRTTIARNSTWLNRVIRKSG